MAPSQIAKFTCVRSVNLEKGGDAVLLQVIVGDWSFVFLAAVFSNTHKTDKVTDNIRFVRSILRPFKKYPLPLA